MNLYLQQFLHERMVQEWMCNSEQYQPFVTVDLVTEAERYMASGVFAGQLGDLMVIILANIISHPIVILTSVPNMPVLCISPLSGETGVGSTPLFLTYLHSVAGHYDYAVPVDHNTEIKHKKK